MNRGSFVILLIICLLLTCGDSNSGAPLTDTFIISAEVKNKQTGEVKIDNLARTIDIELAKNDTKNNVVVNLVLAEGVTMISPATKEAEYNLENAATIRLAAGKREVNFKMSAKSYDPGSETDPDFFPDEVRPPTSISCFQGAYYRKAVSSRDKWRGISVKVVLPEIFYDFDRPNRDKPGQYLDNFSVYLGGNANGQETDIGLTWEVIRNAQGNVTPERLCFRPFWRWTASGGQAAGYANADAQNTDYHYYPGDTLAMSISVIGNGMLRFEIAGHGRISHKKFSVDFPCKGYTLTDNAEYKRVNAIDQVGNEGKPVQPTKAKTEGTEWLETNLLRQNGTAVVSVPMHTGRFTDMRCPSNQNVQVNATEEDKKKGAEKVDIYGTPEG